MDETSELQSESAKVVKAGRLKTRTVKLDEPWKHNGSEVTELKLDFSDINGNELKALEAAFKELYKDYVPVPMMDVRFQELLAARAAHVNPNDLGTMWGPDYQEVLSAARNFLLKTG